MSQDLRELYMTENQQKSEKEDSYIECIFCV
jgi:hypothetical protein